MGAANRDILRTQKCQRHVEAPIMRHRHKTGGNSPAGGVPNNPGASSSSSASGNAQAVNEQGSAITQSENTAVQPAVCRAADTATATVFGNANGRIRKTVFQHVATVHGFAGRDLTP